MSSHYGLYQWATHVYNGYFANRSYGVNVANRQSYS